MVLQCINGVGSNTVALKSNSNTDVYIYIIWRSSMSLDYSWEVMLSDNLLCYLFNVNFMFHLVLLFIYFLFVYCYSLVLFMSMRIVITGTVQSYLYVSLVLFCHLDCDFKYGNLLFLCIVSFVGFFSFRL